MTKTQTEKDNDKYLASRREYLQERISQTQDSLRKAGISSTRKKTLQDKLKSFKDNLLKIKSNSSLKETDMAKQSLKDQYRESLGTDKTVAAPYKGGGGGIRNGGKATKGAGKGTLKGARNGAGIGAGKGGSANRDGSAGKDANYNENKEDIDYLLEKYAKLVKTAKSASRSKGGSSPVGDDDGHLDLDAMLKGARGGKGAGPGKASRDSAAELESDLADYGIDPRKVQEYLRDDPDDLYTLKTDVSDGHLNKSSTKKEAPAKEAPAADSITADGYDIDEIADSYGIETPTGKKNIVNFINSMKSYHGNDGYNEQSVFEDLDFIISARGADFDKATHSEIEDNIEKYMGEPLPKRLAPKKAAPAAKKPVAKKGGSSAPTNSRAVKGGGKGGPAKEAPVKKTATNATRPWVKEFKKLAGDLKNAETVGERKRIRESLVDLYEGDFNATDRKQINLQELIGDKDLNLIKKKSPAMQKLLGNGAKPAPAKKADKSELEAKRKSIESLENRYNNALRSGGLRDPKAKELLQKVNEAKQKYNSENPKAGSNGRDYYHIPKVVRSSNPIEKLEALYEESLHTRNDKTRERIANRIAAIEKKLSPEDKKKADKIYNALEREGTRISSKPKVAKAVPAKKSEPDANGKRYTKRGVTQMLKQLREQNERGRKNSNAYKQREEDIKRLSKVLKTLSSSQPLTLSQMHRISTVASSLGLEDDVIVANTIWGTAGTYKELAKALNKLGIKVTAQGLEDDFDNNSGVNSGSENLHKHFTKILGNDASKLADSDGALVYATLHLAGMIDSDDLDVYIENPKLRKLAVKCTAGLEDDVVTASTSQELVMKRLARLRVDGDEYVANAIAILLGFIGAASYTDEGAFTITGLQSDTKKTASKVLGSKLTRIAKELNGNLPTANLDGRISPALKVDREVRDIGYVRGTVTYKGSSYYVAIHEDGDIDVSPM